MNNNTTNKKKLELKKTAIANLTLSEAHMRAVIGGGGNKNGDSQDENTDKTTCTTVTITVIATDGCPDQGRKTF